MTYRPEPAAPGTEYGITQYGGGTHLLRDPRTIPAPAVCGAVIVRRRTWTAEQLAANPQHLCGRCVHIRATRSENP